MSRTINELKHPNPLDHNRSVIWARNWLQMPNWAILSVKTVPLQEGGNLVAVAVSNSRGRVILDTLVRPAGPVTSELLTKLGITNRELFRAQEPQEVFGQLNKLLNRREILCWNANELRDTVETVSQSLGMPMILMRLVPIAEEYARFLGDREGDHYKVPTLPDLSMRDNCRLLYEILNKMAGSSQINDSASVGDNKWTSAFFKPKAGPIEKLKHLLGMDAE